MATPQIEVREASIHIVDLEVTRKDVADYLRGLPEEERPQAVAQAIEVGVFCLERARSGFDTQFVRREIEGLLAHVEQVTKEIPVTTEQALLKKIGAEDGQILKPLHDHINTVVKVSNERVAEVRQLLEQDMDPSKESSKLGRALADIRVLLDPERMDSIQGRLAEAIRSITERDGSLSKTVRAGVDEAIKPLREEVDRLAKEIRGQDAAEEIRQQTTQKGRTYEEGTLEKLQTWGGGMGAQVHHVGTDNRPGDIVVRIPASSVAGVESNIVIEVRDQTDPSGLKPVSDDLRVAMAERNADAAIYLCRTRAGFAKEIGEWTEGSLNYGPWVATTDEHLITALRFLIVRRQLDEARTQQRDVDTSLVAERLERIQTALRRIATINRHATEVEKAVADGFTSIRSEADLLRNDIRSALEEIEEAIRRASGDEPVATSA